VKLLEARLVLCKQGVGGSNPLTSTRTSLSCQGPERIASPAPPYPS